MSASIPRPPHAEMLAVTLDRARRIVERAQAEGERLSIGEALGFTREDVARLRWIAEVGIVDNMIPYDLSDYAADILAVCAKLAALLPPEGT